MTPEFKDALAKARMDMLRKPKAVFISTVALMMRQVVDNTIRTAATDGLAIYYSENFFLGLTRPQRITLLGHEAMHPALLHLDPAYSHLDQDRLNRAGDYVINQFLLDAGFEALPNWLHDPKYKGLTTMQVYKLLETEDQEKTENGEGKPSAGDWADLRPAEPGKDGQSPQEQAEAVRQMVASAAQAVQMAAADGRDPGAIPADVLLFLENLLKPKLPMGVHLRRWFTELDKSDYSWKKPNRRYAPMIMPGLSGQNKLTHLAFVFDMSCSVTDKDIQRYVSELVGVMRRYKPDKITVVQFDTSIKSTHLIKTVRDMANVQLRGRGGTDIECVLEWVQKNKPTGVVVFSDGEYFHPSFNPKCSRFLWMIHGPRRELFHCDFGTTIRFDTDGDS